MVEASVGSALIRRLMTSVDKKYAQLLWAMEHAQKRYFLARRKCDEALEEYTDSIQEIITYCENPSQSV